MSEEIYIKTAADARKCIDEKVYWDDVGPKWIFLRSGYLQGISGQELVIDGDYKLKSRLSNLRNFEMGGEWKTHQEQRAKEGKL